MKKVAAGVGLVALILGVVIAIRVVAFALSDPPTVDAQRRDKPYTGTPAAALVSNRSEMPKARMFKFVDSTERFVIQGSVEPGSHTGHQLYVDISCFNNRGSAGSWTRFTTGPRIAAA